MSRRRQANPFSLFSFQDIITSVSGIIILVTLMLAIELLQRKNRAPVERSGEVVANLQSAIAEAEQEIDRKRQQLAQGAEAVAKLAGNVPGKVDADTRALQQRLEQIEDELARLADQEEAAKKALIEAQAKKFDRRADADELARMEQQIDEIHQEVQEIQSGERRIYNPTASDGRRVWLVQLQSGRILVARPGVRDRPHVYDQAKPEERLKALAEWLDSNCSPQTDTFFLLVGPDAVLEFSAIAVGLDARGYTDYGFDVLGPDESPVDSEQGAGP